MRFEPVIRTAVEAGQAIMAIYNGDFAVEEKADNSPLTEADLAAHRIIVDGLPAMREQAHSLQTASIVGGGLGRASSRGNDTTREQADASDRRSLPVLSEESADIPWSERKTWQRYWLVDPLDGTKEFINRNGEFTVNIALIEKGEPIWGVVYAPALNTLYQGGPALNGAWKLPVDPVGGGLGRASLETTDPVGGGLGRASLETTDPVGGGLGRALKIQVAETNPTRPTRIVGSRSHQSPEFQEFIAQFTNPDIKPMGSSLKICLVAEGEADVYPRLGPTSEWDTAAAHAILLGAGGTLVDANTGKPLRYNQKNSVLNPHFIAWGAPKSL